ncbi:DUF2993 domain-containing protein [Catellatospora sp. KI3]|uniref:LmeA family phospholipid-binding protein n=1 Tax=Catellatospora sp. KI3 TaxID=3041620 RepID=UPI002482BB0E|nr:DUF2993 domain-containing protein [Catellatospora sp. KI3]MDI1465784.1 DUF2993 domain-containing protein [Catellatospora sp. KI3]
MRRALRVTAVVAVVLGVLLVVADRVGAHVAEDQIAQRVATRLQERGITSSPPKVSITGVPFLTQVAAGRYDEIDLTLRDLKGGTLPLPLLTVQAHDVVAPTAGVLDGTVHPVAQRVTGTATVSYADLVAASGLANLTLRAKGEREVQVSGKLPLLGDVTGAAEVSVVGGKVRLRATELRSSLGGVSQALLDTYREKLAVTLSLPKLPFDLALTDLRTAETGLLVSFTAAEVELA